MKKNALLIFVLCLFLLAQTVCTPVFATETGSTETTPSESLPAVTIPTVAFGTASVRNGCRTIDGQMPLAGSGRMTTSCLSAFIYERNTDTVIYAFNPDTEVYPGSLAQIMTALIVIEKCTMTETVTVSSRNISRLPAGSRHVDLKEGEELSVQDLLYCMMMQSANDAAIALAEHVAGSIDEFVVLMNERAKEIGCTSTNFVNVHGLDDAAQHTTARDMAKITLAAVENPVFMEIFSSISYEVPETNKSEKRDLDPLNYLLQNTIVTKFIHNKVTGGKPTYSSTAGASIAITAKEKDEGGMDLILVVMGATRVFAENGYTATTYGNFEEVSDLLDYTLRDFRVCQLLYDGQALEQFTVANGTNSVVGMTHTTMDAVLPKTSSLNTLQLKYNVRGGGLTAPIARDQLIATLQLWYQNSCVAETELYSMSSVKQVDKSGVDIQSATRDDSNFADILSFLGTVILVILVPVTIYLVINNIRRSIAMRRRRRRRRSRRRSR